MIFVPWKKGPEWYLKFSPILVYVLLITNYLVIPAINIGLAIFFIVDPAYTLVEQSIQSYVVFFNVVCISRIFEYFTLIRRTVLDEARNYLAAKKALENQVDEEGSDEAV